jgi:uncharacterized membrane protein YbhN (UPF0104 family)
LLWKLALTLLATLVLLIVLVRDFGGSSFLSAVRHARLAWVGAAFFVSCACVLLGALRWHLILKAMGYELGFGRALEVVLATWPPAVVTPSRANELLRAVAVRDVVPLASGTGSVLAEKAIDLLGLLALAGLGAALRAFWVWSALIGAALSLEVATIVVLANRRGWLERIPLVRRRPGTIDELFLAFDALGRDPRRLASVVASSLAIRLLTVGVTQALLVAVDANVRWFDTLTLWPAAMLVGVIPVTLGGMGTRDAAFVFLLRARALGVAQANVLAATMGYSGVAIWSFAVIGLPLMVRAVLSNRRA